jgi:hypothetical protein
MTFRDAAAMYLAENLGPLYRDEVPVLHQHGISRRKF